jgi:integrase
MTNELPGGSRVPTLKLEQRGQKQTYHASFWHQGKHHRFSLKTSNRKEAERRLLRLAARLEQGEGASTPRLTVDEGVAKYLEYLRTAHRRPKTVTKYTTLLDNFATFLRDEHVTLLRAIRPTHLDAYRSARLECWKEYTLFNHCIIIKQLFRWLANRGLVQPNPLGQYQVEKPKRQKYPSPLHDEVRNILRLVPSHYRLPIRVLACTGMRSGELCRLRVEDVDLRGNWFHVRSRPGAETKSGRDRKVPIHPSLRAGLEGHRPRSEWYFALPSSRQYPEGGRQLHPKRLNECFTRRVRYAGLTAGRPEKGFVIHSLRGFFKSFAINRGGVHQAVVDAWLEHSQQGMNPFYYQLPDADSQQLMAQVPFDLE